MNEQKCPNCGESMRHNPSNSTQLQWYCGCGLSFPWASTLEASTAAFERLRDPLAGGEWPRCPECGEALYLSRFIASIHAVCKCPGCSKKNGVLAVAPTLPALLAKLREPPKPKLEPCPACGAAGAQSESWVRCSVLECTVQGPSGDPDGSKWNSMCRGIAIKPPALDKPLPCPEHP